ncbi:trypsin-like peptidase domain-containing protein [Archangium violaceum]|uniref:S1 family peptidase n=1 Tax=Archangium violaceum TaxID=83451 RepID=UPI00193C6EA7|nr:serine protease [Archangium violaceum]QRK04500.1 trypsin-like peptidase domain-containing protein [Archangium violaceum]
MLTVDTDLSTARAVAARAAPSLAILEMPSRQGVGFVAAPHGLLVTNLHVVAGAEEIHVLLADEQLLQVEQVVALDEKRDLAVLKLPTHDVEALRFDGGASPGEGDALFILLPAGGGMLGLMETRVHAVQVLDESLTFLELEASLPEDASGSPVMDARGELVGVATCAFADGRPVTIVIPSRYVVPLLDRPGTQPLSTLAVARPAASRERQVPSHPLSLLEGCATDGVEEIALAIMQAIQLGAPAYNRGDPEACYRLYERTAERLLKERSDCPGAQLALREGLQRCARLDNADSCAWALRDTFDGLLHVIDRWLQAQAAFARMSAPKSYLQ